MKANFIIPPDAIFAIKWTTFYCFIILKLNIVSFFIFVEKCIGMTINRSKKIHLSLPYRVMTEKYFKLAPKLKTKSTHRVQYYIIVRRTQFKYFKSRVFVMFVVAKIVVRWLHVKTAAAIAMLCEKCSAMISQSRLFPITKLVEKVFSCYLIDYLL